MAFSKVLILICLVCLVSMSMAQTLDTCKSDVVFILDHSGSMTKDQYISMLDFASAVMAALPRFGRPDGARVGLITFSYNSEVVFDLAEHQTIAEATKATADSLVLFHGETTMTHLALADATKMLNAYRGYRNQKVFLVTDGRPNLHDETEAEVNKLKQAGADIIIVAIGNWVNTTELRKIAAKETDYIVVEQDTDLLPIADTLASHLCDTTCMNITLDANPVLATTIDILPTTPLPPTTKTLITQPPTTQPPTQPATTQPPTQPPTTQPLVTEPLTVPPTQPLTTETLVTEPLTEPPTTLPATEQPLTEPLTTEPPTEPPTQPPTQPPPTELSTTCQPTTEPITEPLTTEPPITKPVTEPPTTEIATTVPVTIEPETSVPTTFEPRTTLPLTIEPGTTIPPTIEPATTVPMTIQPATTVPPTIEPGTTEPYTTQPGTTIPATIEPTTNVPLTLQPGTTVPPTFEPGTTIPATIEPGTTVPHTTQPGTTVPLTIDPVTTVPLTIKPRTQTPTPLPPTWPATQPPTQLPPTQPSMPTQLPIQSIDVPLVPLMPEFYTPTWSSFGLCLPNSNDTLRDTVNLAHDIEYLLRDTDTFNDSIKQCYMTTVKTLQYEIMNSILDCRRIKKMTSCSLAIVNKIGGVDVGVITDATIIRDTWRGLDIGTSTVMDIREGWEIIEQQKALVGQMYEQLTNTVDQTEKDKIIVELDKLQKVIMLNEKKTAFYGMVNKFEQNVPTTFEEIVTVTVELREMLIDMGNSAMGVDQINIEQSVRNFDDALEINNRLKTAYDTYNIVNKNSDKTQVIKALTTIKSIYTEMNLNQGNNWIQMTTDWSITSAIDGVNKALDMYLGKTFIIAENITEVLIIQNDVLAELTMMQLQSDNADDQLIQQLMINQLDQAITLNDAKMTHNALVAEFKMAIEDPSSDEAKILDLWREIGESLKNLEMSTTDAAEASQFQQEREGIEEKLLCFLPV